MTSFMRVECNRESKFPVWGHESDTLDITFNGLSEAFIQGFQLARTMIGYNAPADIVETNIKYDSSDVIYSTNESCFHNNLFVESYNFFDDHISIKDLVKDSSPEKFLSFCIHRKIGINKQYVMLLVVNSQVSFTVDMKIVQFDSPDFISGFRTYLSWMSGGIRISIYNVYDYNKFEEHKLQIEYQSRLVIKREEIKRVIKDLTLDVIANIVWRYIAIQCKSEYNNGQCITDFIPTDDVDNDQEYTTDGELINLPECPYCEKHVISKPFLCKVTIIG